MPMIRGQFDRVATYLGSMAFGGFCEFVQQFKQFAIPRTLIEMGVWRTAR